MTDKFIIYKNKEEVFKCHLNIEGSSTDDAIVRLCLEVGDRNLFFNGTIAESGECVIHIPRLKELKTGLGKLSVEAIADSTYFKLYESELELKNSVEIKLEKPEMVGEHRREFNIKIDKLKKEEVVATKEEKVSTLKKEDVTPIPPKVENPFISKKTKPKSAFDVWRETRNLG